MSNFDEALTGALVALRRAIASTLYAARTSSEVSRQTAAAEADIRLLDAHQAIENLVRVAATSSPNSGDVGDGLDAERGQARVAIGLLREILVNHVDQDGYERQAEPAVLRFGGSCFVSGEELALVDALMKETG
jgi:hypothetical protein